MCQVFNRRNRITNLLKTRKWVRIVFAAMIVLSAGGIRAQEAVVELTLAQARDYAVQHNKSLMNARDAALNSKLKVKEMIAQGLPQVDGSISYMTYFNYEMEFSMGSSDSDPVINYALLDLGDYELLSAIGQMFGSSEPIMMSDQLTGKLQLSQLIFSGQFIAGIQTAKIARKMADQGVTVSEIDVRENVTQSYYLILTSEYTLKILKKNLDNLYELLQHTTNLYNAGVAEETDVDQLRISVSQLKNTEKSLERMNQLNYNMMKFQLGVPPETRLLLTDSLSFLLAGIIPDLPLDSGFSVSANINYQLVESQVELTQKQLELQKWAYAPTIAGYYNYTGKILKTGFDLTPNHLAGINMSVPIFSSGIRKAQLSQSRVNHDMAQRNLEIVKDQLELQQTQLLFVYQNALENYHTQKENVVIAGRVFQNIRNKYEHGLSSSLDLTQANSNYLNAESNYLSAVLTLLQARTSLDKLYNKL